MVVDPHSQTIAIEVKLQLGRHTIDKVKLATIYIASEENMGKPHLEILTDNSVSINAIHNCITDPMHL
jgi:hypothetical protein